jgi:hypothetical protein
MVGNTYKGWAFAQEHSPSLAWSAPSIVGHASQIENLTPSRRSKEKRRRIP